MANLNIASPPASKTDDRRQSDASKREANEKSQSGPSSAKSADGAVAKVAEEPKAVARAKAAPESAAAATGTATTGTVAGISGGKAGADRSTAGGAGAGSAVGARPGDTAAGRAADTSAREVNEAITIVTSAPGASPVLRSADGARWWRIRAPSTIEGSADRGATWTVEYSDPSSVLVRGVAGSKSGCWMIGANGLVLRTRPNGGWERVTQPTTRGLATLTSIDHLIATVTDDQGRTYRTTDGGVTWR
jgi:hypothetical protein